MKNPYIGMCVWPVPDKKEILVTMFRDPNKDEYDNKDWFFILEDVNPSGKRKPVAQGRLNMKDFSTAVPTQHNLTVKLRPISKKVTAAKLTLSLTAELLKEGKATDDDMRSIASLVGNSTVSGDYGNSLLEEVNEEVPEESLSGSNSIKDEISSITKQFESLNRRASEDAVPVRTVPHRTSPRTSEKIHGAQNNLNSEIDENKNTAPSSSFSDSSKIKQVDILPGKDTNHRFKSTYNGPMGDYKQRRSGSEIDRQKKLSDVELTPNGDTTPVNEDPLKSLEASFPPPIPLRPDKVVETITVAATIESPPKDQSPAKEDSTPVKETTTPLKEIETPDKDTVTPVKYQRTKSQEFRDYQHEFVLSSIIDFGPLQTSNPGDFSQVTSTPVSKPPPVSVRDPSPLSPVKKPISPSHVAPKELPPVNTNVKSPSTPAEEIHPKNSVEKPEVEENYKVTNVSTGDSENNSQSSQKVEIKPSKSFLLDLNRNSAYQETDTTSSDSTPIIETKKKPLETNHKLEKMLSDRTNSLLRKNPTKTADDLLEWAKKQLSGYTNVKVTNFTTSWRNGLAFCGLIHSFYPDLIAYDTLTQHDIKHNCKLAFEAGEKLGITQLIEPETMVIKRIPDKLAVITYLHQLRSQLGQEEANTLYEKSKDEQLVPATGVRKSFSEGHISLFSRSTSNDMEKSDLETIEENPSVDIKPEKINEYTKGAKTLIEQARSESKDSDEEIPDLEQTTRGNSSSPPKVVMRQKSNTPKSKKDNRLSYFDNEMQMLDSEQHEIDIQAGILDKRLRETSEDDQVLYDALLQQWFTLVNKKNALLRRQMQLNILKKEDNLEKKLQMLQEELRGLSEMEESRKTDEDRKREDLLLQELVLVVNKRNELVMQRDEEEQMVRDMEQLDEEITLPENNHLRLNRRDECKMQ